LVCVARDLASELARPDGRQLLQRALDAGPVEICVLGVSMRPLLRTGDRIRLDRRTPRRGDVALVEVSKRLMLHRLVRRRRDRWLVRGDARSRSDGWIAAHQVLAIATARRRDTDSRANPRPERLRSPRPQCLSAGNGRRKLPKTTTARASGCLSIATPEAAVTPQKEKHLTISI
jgi:hypothetical protein